MTAEKARAPELPELHFEVAVPASRERVFQAWTDPDQLRDWLVLEGYEMKSAVVDARVGGDFRFEYRAPDGEIVYVVGTYIEVDPPGRLAFTWLYEGVDQKETFVTVELREAKGDTQVVLTHKPFFVEEYRGLHEFGWSTTLPRLASLLDLR